MALTKLTTDLIDGSLGTDWQATPKTANFTAVAGEGYFVDTTSAAITVTLPGSPSAGDEVSIVDYAGTANTNIIRITSSDNINGASDDVVIDYERGGVSMVYVDATQGWIAYNATNETATALNNTPLTTDILVVAGGGGGGGGITGDTAGGGGAGAVLYGTNLNALSANTTYDINIGGGGSGGVTENGPGNQGSDSYIQFSSTYIFRAKGGGGGKTNVSSDYSGGSGGGGTRDSDDAYENGGLAVTTNVTPTGVTAYGNDGQAGNNSTIAGGGGGAGNTSSTAGDGGAGIQINIDGNNYYWGGGGGGANDGDGGIGGGGGATTDISGQGQGGASAINPGQDGTSTSGGNGGDNTGGGGGGAGGGGSSPDTGGNGGDGIIIIKYPDLFALTVGSGLTYSTDTSTFTGYDVTTFTAGTGTISFS